MLLVKQLQKSLVWHRLVLEKLAEYDVLSLPNNLTSFILTVHLTVK